MTFTPQPGMAYFGWPMAWDIDADLIRTATLEEVHQFDLQFGDVLDLRDPNNPQVAGPRERRESESRAGG